MINRDCKHMTRENKLSLKELLIAGGEFVAAMACGVSVIIAAALIVTMLN